MKSSPHKESFSDDYVEQCLKSTLKQRLEWLEEANEFVRMVQVSKLKRVAARGLNNDIKGRKE